MQENTIELVGRSDTDRAGEFHSHLQGVMIRNRSLKQTVISLSSYEAELYAASACVAELLGIAEIVKGLPCTLSVKLELDSDSQRHVLQRRGSGGLRHIEIRC